MSHVEKGMTNKEAVNKFGVPKRFEESALSTKKLRGCQYENVDKALFEWFLLQRSQNIFIDWSMIQKKDFSLPKNWRSLTLTLFRMKVGEEAKRPPC